MVSSLGFARTVGTLLVGSGLFIACKQWHEGTRESPELQEALPDKIQEADSILIVGQVVDPSSAQQVLGEAIAILAGRILAVSTRDGILRYRGVRTVLQEFRKASAFPGLIDAHGHLLGLGAGEQPPVPRSCSKVLDRPPEDPEQALLRAQRVCLEAGITRVHDAGTSTRVRRTLRRLEQEGRWKLGVYGMLLPEGDRLPPVDDPGPAARLRFPAVKLFADGPAGSMSEHELERRVALCIELGYQPCAHVAGQRAGSLVLGVYGRMLRGDRSSLRPRIEHAGLVSQDDMPRFATLGILACMQPSGRTGEPSAVSARGFLDRGVRVCFGSDFRVAPASPCEGIYAAVSGHRISRREAVLGYSGWAAYAAGEEGVRGRIRPGFVADLTILDRNLLEVPERALLGTKVLATVVSGETVHRSDREKLPWMDSRQR